MTLESPVYRRHAKIVGEDAKIASLGIPRVWHPFLLAEKNRVWYYPGSVDISTYFQIGGEAFPEVEACVA